MHALHILEATAGGTRRHILDLLPELMRRGIKCSLIYSPLRNPDFEKDAAFLRQTGVITYRVPMTRGWDNAIDNRALRSIRSIVGKSTFDIIHAHSSKAGFLGRSAILPRHESTFIYTPHCIAFDTALPGIHRHVARLAETLLAPLTDHFIAVSAQEKQAILRARLASPRKVQLIYNGVDPTEFDVQQNLNSAFTIGCFGRLSYQKNQKFALKVLFELRKHQKDIQVLFAGEGECKTELQKLSRQLQLDSAVVWHGESANLAELYAQCDAIIQPSRWEGCPYTVLEAMAASRPVIASPAGAMPHLLDGCGEIHSLSQIDEWLETLLRWKDDVDLRRGLGKTSRERAQKYFSLERMIDEIEQLYLSATNN